MNWLTNRTYEGGSIDNCHLILFPVLPQYIVNWNDTENAILKPSGSVLLTGRINYTFGTKNDLKRLYFAFIINWVTLHIHTHNI